MVISDDNSRESKRFVQIEQGVLGALVLDAPRVAPALFARVRADDFADGMHKRLFETSQRMYANGDAIDALTLCGAAGDAESRQYIMDMMAVTPTAAHHEEYITILLDQSKRRKAAQIGMRLYDLAMLGANVGELQEQAEALAEVMTGRGGARSVSMQTMLYDFFEHVGQKRTYLDWGFSRLNTHLYCEAGDYIVIGARPSVGKTAFALNLSANIAKTHRVTFFSLETGQQKITDRMMTAASSVPLNHIKRGELTNDELSLLAMKKDRLLELDFHFVPAAGMTAEDIRAETLRSKSEVIVIDYIGLINHRDKKLSEYAVVTENSKALQRLAHGTNTFVIALSQLNRGGNGMEALRGSGQIEQDADVILSLEHVKPEGDEDDDAARNDSRRVLHITKNKDGICGKIKLWFEGAVQRFTEEWDGFYSSPVRPLLDKTVRRAIAQNTEPAQQTIKMIR